MSLTVLCGLSISTNNCLALLPYGKGLKTCDGEHTPYKQMGRENREWKHKEPAACVGKPGGSTEADVSAQPPSGKKARSLDAPVISYLEVCVTMYLNESSSD